jgi:hypothetical protein
LTTRTLERRPNEGDVNDADVYDDVGDDMTAMLVDDADESVSDQQQQPQQQQHLPPQLAKSCSPQGRTRMVLRSIIQPRGLIQESAKKPVFDPKLAGASANAPHFWSDAEQVYCEGLLDVTFCRAWKPASAWKSWI